MIAATPRYTEADLETILVSKEQIRKRVEELGRDLSKHFEGKDVTVVSILSGALVFTADLIRSCDFATRLDCLRAESYGNLMSADAPPRITNPLKTDISGRHVLVVDDILDSGNTLRAIIKYLSQAEPASLSTCVLLDKPSRHSSEFTADFKGFTIPDEFVVGYGLDFAERYRNLSCIGVLKKDLQKQESHA
ncbi:hypoxanthine phosphoribosyltransferase [Pelagicoccus sp. SDUM812003]|uniref:hypoxanthine phosphoribosyltransferase n=1 Tax=Pelagicoccus sp. SDUM812003 TaxID=3041267 RepID=UPI00280D3BA5|nr:hypoxanthine phosphoribosyltransferase [Pelagicoccus sp. SDUM812003]MDQ8201980.1 hypoxanthine phosphoribosyltransferase [Pelagicoccus sp. SDUM812003]